jgi:hypothetical protein
VCNICHSRIINNNTSTDDLLQIIIINDDREEYALLVSKSIIISLLTNIDNSCNDIGQNLNEETWINSLINLMVRFKFDQNTGVISELTTITEPHLKNEGINKVLQTNFHFLLYI